MKTTTQSAADPAVLSDRCMSVPSAWIRCRSIPKRLALSLSDFRASDMAAGLLLLALLAAFVVLKAFAFLPREADEGIYTYGAMRMAEGAIPYRDFFFAHPPLHLAIPAAVFWLLGRSDPLIAKWLLLAAAVVQAVAIYLVVRRLSPVAERRWAVTGAVTATALLLFSLPFLATTSYDAGVTQATAWLALAALLMVWQRPTLAGLAAGMGTMTMLQATPLALALTAGAFIHDRRWGIRCSLGLAGIVVAVHAVCLAVAGSAFIDQIYLFHFAKRPIAVSGWTKLAGFLKESIPLLVVGLAGAVAIAVRQPRRRGLMLVLLGGVTVHAVLMATRPAVFFYYFHPMLFPMAVVAGMGIALALERLFTDEDPSPHRKRLGRILRGSGVAAALLTGYAFAPTRGAADETQADLVAVGASQRPSWTAAPGLGRVNHFLEGQFWGSGPSPRGYTNVVTRFLWSAANWSDHPVRISEFIRTLARSRPGMTLLGDSTLVPWLASETNLRIVGDLIDTNDQRITAGYLKVDQITRALETAPDPVLVLAEGGIIRFPEFKAYVYQRYRPVEQVHSREGRAYTIYERATN